MFALRKKATEELMGFASRDNGDADYCVGVSFSLEKYCDNVWVVTSRETAEAAAINSSEWYNAAFETPENSYIGELEVVELKIS